MKEFITWIHFCHGAALKRICELAIKCRTVVLLRLEDCANYRKSIYISWIPLRCGKKRLARTAAGPSTRSSSQTTSQRWCWKKWLARLLPKSAAFIFTVFSLMALAGIKRICGLLNLLQRWKKIILYAKILIFFIPGALQCSSSGARLRSQFKRVSTRRWRQEGPTSCALQMPSLQETAQNWSDIHLLPDAANNKESRLVDTTRCGNALRHQVDLFL